ncbi:MAG: hypothetical protein C0404_00775 [Verrucomicrobia bacterium]|nr:hypothetical protein [Verrucomicrobiota bacterium]
MVTGPECVCVQPIRTLASGTPRARATAPRRSLAKGGSISNRSSEAMTAVSRPFRNASTVASRGSWMPVDIRSICG